MSGTRSQILEEGYLDIKEPSNSPERKIYKAWRRLWISAAVVQSTESRREPSLLINLTRHKRAGRSRQVTASRDGLRLFRCSSASRPFCTFAISSSAGLLLYLSADSEYESQQWMEKIREGLWPSLTPRPLDRNDSFHEVSLIDDEDSFACGLLGLYGRLTVSPESVFSVVHPHWLAPLIRWTSSDVREIRIHRRMENKCGAGVFVVTLQSGDGMRNLRFFSNSAISAVEWMNSQMDETIKNSTKISVCSTKLQNTPTIICNEQTECLSQTLYANMRLSDDAQPYGKINSPRPLPSDVPCDFLDATITLTKNDRTVTGESSSSSDCDNTSNRLYSNEDSDDSDHIYENMNTCSHSRSESVGAWTVYEEVDDDSDYVPPCLNPPELPPRLNNSCESIKNTVNTHTENGGSSVTSNQTHSVVTLIPPALLQKSNIPLISFNNEEAHRGTVGNAVLSNDIPTPAATRTLISPSLPQKFNIPLMSFKNEEEAHRGTARNPVLSNQIPTPAATRPNNLRLMKLSDRINEELKMSEAGEGLIEKRPGLIQKIIGKCRSLQTSPLHENAELLPSFSSLNGNRDVRRTASEPDDLMHNTVNQL